MRQGSSWLSVSFLTVSNSASLGKNIIGHPYGNASQKYLHRHLQWAVQGILDPLYRGSGFAKTSSLRLFFCIYSIPCEFIEQMLVSHCPMAENLVLFMTHICESHFSISFIFKEDSSFTGLLGPVGMALETRILERWLPESGATPRQRAAISQVKSTWMWDFGFRKTVVCEHLPATQCQKL